MAESKRPKKTKTESAPPLNTVACDCSSLGDGASCGDTAQEPTGRSWVKTAVASVVIVAAIAAAAYSIIRNGSNTAEPTDQTGAAANCTPSANGCGSSLFGLSGDSTISPIAVAVLTSVVADVDVAFVLLSGTDNGAAQNAVNAIEGVIDKLAAQGKKVKVVSFVPGSPGYIGLVQLGRLRSFPSVAVLGSKGGYAFLVSNEISEVKLLRSFVVAATPIPGCAPGAPGCAPTGRK